MNQLTKENVEECNVGSLLYYSGGQPIGIMIKKEYRKDKYLDFFYWVLCVVDIDGDCFEVELLEHNIYF